MWVNSGLGKERTITIMKSSTNRIFGGYMNIRWEKLDFQDSGWRKDPKSFIFSLTHKDSLLPDDDKYAVHFNAAGMIGFGGNSLGIVSP